MVVVAISKCCSGMVVSMLKRKEEEHVWFHATGDHWCVQWERRFHPIQPIAWIVSICMLYSSVGPARRRKGRKPAKERIKEVGISLGSSGSGSGRRNRVMRKRSKFEKEASQDGAEHKLASFLPQSKAGQREARD